MGVLFNCYQAARMWLRGRDFGIAAIRGTKRMHLALWRLFHSQPKRQRLSRAGLEALLQRPITIFTTDYCMFVARVYAYHLQKMGYKTRITTEPMECLGDGFHVLVSAQLLPQLPKHYAVVQMEQLEASTWYGLHYHKVMCGADAVFEYNRINIDFLKRCRLGNIPVQYVPITILGDQKVQSADTPRKCDVVFYGGLGHERRPKALALLQKHCKVEIISHLFGEELHDALRSAKIVINIHQYDKALLETTRLYECLSLGLFIVSEDSSNSGDFPTLRENISWFDEGDWEGMVAAVRRGLENDAAREQERQVRYARAAREADSFGSCFRAFLETHE